MVVNEHTLHLEVGLLAVLLVLEFDKCILQTVPSALISDHLARQDNPKATEDQLKILVCQVLAHIQTESLALVEAP